MIGGGQQRAPLPTGPSKASRAGLQPSSSAAADEAAPPNRDKALRSTFVDKEEAAMLRAMARLNGDDAKTRDIGNTYSNKNRVKAAARQKEAAALGLTPLDPLEQHELQRKMAAGYTKVSERAVPVPRVGHGPPRPEFHAVDFIPRRKAEEDIRDEFNHFETPQAPPGRPVRSNDDVKDELALRNQFNGRTPQEMLAAAPKKAAPPQPKSPSLRQQIEDEVAERHDFLDQMTALGRPVAPEIRSRIDAEIADRLHDLKRLEELGGDGT